MRDNPIEAVDVALVLDETPQENRVRPNRSPDCGRFVPKQSAKSWLFSGGVLTVAAVVIFFTGSKELALMMGMISVPTAACACACMYEPPNRNRNGNRVFADIENGENLAAEPTVEPVVVAEIINQNQRPTIISTPTAQLVVSNQNDRSLQR